MKGIILAGIFVAAVIFVFAPLGAGAQPADEEAMEEAIEQATEPVTEPAPQLDVEKVTTSWNLTFLYENRDEGTLEFDRLKQDAENINQTYRPAFEELDGTVLLGYLEDEKNLSISIDLLSSYVYAENSLNVNDEFFETFISEIQTFYADYYRITAFAEIKLKSLSKEEWEELFGQEPGLEKYRTYLENTYIRYADHRPRNETHAAFIAEIADQRMKLETEANKEITNNVTVAGNITLTDGQEYPIDAQSYYKLLATDQDRENRKTCYDKRFYHLKNESDKMAALYLDKAKKDDLIDRELNYSDAYAAKMFESYLSEDQIEDMNSVFKERKGAFVGYHEFRRAKMGVDRLMPYDLQLQLMDDPDEIYNYTDTLAEVEASYVGMDPIFGEIFIKTVTGDLIDVYPDQENGKQPGGYCMSLFPLKLPGMIFLNYDGLIDDKKTVTHEMGHAINFYLMANAVDYVYCGGEEYEMEIPSTFNEELFVDYVLENYDRDIAVAVLDQHIRGYDNYFTFQPMITEFEHNAHILCDGKDEVSGAELNALWTDLYKEYRDENIGYYDEDSAEWTYISHIYFTNNYYTFSYSLSKAITLSLFKKYKENPEDFNERYVGYLSAGTTMTPPEKLEKYFGIEINRTLFEDAMDVVEMRVNQLQELDEAGR
ncbi:MAG TPA: peptidase [Methanothrix sp.]|nr:peptidase [Methanothrix sp.]